MENQTVQKAKTLDFISIENPLLLINGKLVSAENNAVFENINPSTKDICGYVPDASANDMNNAISAARKAFDLGKWSNDHEFRKHCLLQLRDAMVEEHERLRRVLMTEAGSPVSLTYGIQLQFPLDEIAYWAEVAGSFKYERDIEPHTTFGTISRRKLRYEAIGVVAAITPWNYPIYLNIAESIPALAAGNTVILKPSELTPWSGLELGRLVVEKTDIPPGVFNVVTTNSSEVSSLLTKDPRIDMVTFTGSTVTGKKVLRATSDTVKKVFLELGGKSAHIVLDDADFQTVLPTAAGTICVHSGQGCTLSTRLLLPIERYQEGLKILTQVFNHLPIGDVRDMKTIQGPQIDEKQQNKVLAMIEEGKKSGARILAGGNIPLEYKNGYYVSATLLADVDPRSVVAQEEIFGPVLCVIPYSNIEEAIEIANGTLYGLAGEVSSASEERALEVARRMRAGSISVNGGLYFGLTTPLGGYKQSGLGRRNGEDGFTEYMELKAIGLKG